MANALEIAEQEITNIVNKRSTTAFEKRITALRDEIEVAKNEATRHGQGYSGALVKTIIELRCKAVRDIVLGRFTIAKEIRSQYRLGWTDESLNATAKDLEEWIEGQFAGQRDVLGQDLGRMWTPGDSAKEWPFRELEREQASLAAEVTREIEALRSEWKLQQLTAGQNLPQSRTIHIHISGGQIGVLNVAGIIDSIEQNLSAVTQAGGENLVQSIKCLTEAVMASNELKEDQIKQALEHLEFLSSQAALPTEKRSKAGVVRSVLDGFSRFISTAADVSQIWSTWGPQIEAALRSTGVI
jgi:hypothetical protein